MADSGRIFTGPVSEREQKERPCHQCASVCAVCHHVVRGLFVWCQGCGHGGHLEHMRSWLRDNTHCPTGCGHLCEYT